MRRAIIMCCFLLTATTGATDKDTVIYQTKKNFWNKEKAYLTTDFSNYKHIRDIDAYNPVYHTPPLRQDTTNTCWCFR